MKLYCLKTNTHSIALCALLLTGCPFLLNGVPTTNGLASVINSPDNGLYIKTVINEIVVLSNNLKELLEQFLSGKNKKKYDHFIEQLNGKILDPLAEIMTLHKQKIDTAFQTNKNVSFKKSLTIIDEFLHEMFEHLYVLDSILEQHSSATSSQHHAQNGYIQSFIKTITVPITSTAKQLGILQRAKSLGDRLTEYAYANEDNVQEYRQKIDELKKHLAACEIEIEGLEEIVTILSGNFEKGKGAICVDGTPIETMSSANIWNRIANRMRC